MQTWWSCSWAWNCYQAKAVSEYNNTKYYVLLTCYCYKRTFSETHERCMLFILIECIAHTIFMWQENLCNMGRWHNFSISAMCKLDCQRRVKLGLLLVGLSASCKPFNYVANVTSHMAVYIASSLCKLQVILSILYSCLSLDSQQPEASIKNELALTQAMTCFLLFMWKCIVA